jgi:hypothetical protein
VSALCLVDVVDVARATIAPIYLLDAALKAAFVVSRTAAVSRRPY